MSETLYYTSSSCGASNFIAAHYAGVKLASEPISIPTHKLIHGGADFYKINPKGNVPAITLADGTLLNENVATHAYIASKAPVGKLAPAVNTHEYFKYINDLAWVASELHKSTGNLWMAKYAQDEATKTRLQAEGAKAFNTKIEYFLQHMLGSKPFVGGATPSSVDFYAFIVLSWAPYLSVEIPAAATKYVEKMYALPEVVEARAIMTKAESS